MPMPMPVPQAEQQPNAITIEMVTAMGDAQAQKNFLGEHLYVRVAAVDNELAGRIVGMVLDAYTTEQIIDNLHSDASLQTTIARAKETIAQHQTQ
mmetsp:Transcript_24704/g.33041  ORF Transcript_24704/g.33041 Transcript_24704/m.33041 type:complete len:95 (-) Transcript_24704:314-598(-)